MILGTAAVPYEEGREERRALPAGGLGLLSFLNVSRLRLREGWGAARMTKLGRRGWRLGFPPGEFLGTECSLS